MVKKEVERREKGVVFDWGVDPGFIIKSWAGVCWAKDWVWIWVINKEGPVGFV